MSIVNTKNGRYIKVIRNSCVFRPDSVMISYYVFESREAKEAYFAREKEIKDFLHKANSYISSLEAQLQGDLIEYAKDKGLKESDLISLPNKFKKRLGAIQLIRESVNDVKFNWNSASPLPQYQNLDILIEIGFDRAWLTPLPVWDIQSVHTGAFTNQTFSYACLYKELKKIFKDDYVDC